jgi:putative addiction module CopG family antidote
MNINLKPELQQFVEEQVKTGLFASPEDVIEAGLGRLRADDFGDFRPGELEGLIDTAEAQFARGEGHTLEEVRRHFGDKAAG